MMDMSDPMNQAMAALEEEGYLHQPHTSAGRVPTDKGYRLFVDRLSTVRAMSSASCSDVRGSSGTRKSAGKRE